MRSSAELLAGRPVVIAERPVALRGSRIARALLRLAGWRLLFDGLPARQGVAVIYPHTSNWDFVVGVLAKWGIGIPVTFWGKDSLFRVPLMGRWMRWIGGVPVRRDAAQGAVGQMIDRMRAAKAGDAFQWLALAPEGTRSLTPGWRSGFYRVAVDADVPVACVVLDFGARQVGILQCLRLCGQPEQDLAAIAQAFAGCRGMRPALAAPIRLMP